MGVGTQSNRNNLSSLTTSKNRSKSIDPTAKKMLRLPETTRKTKLTNLYANED